MNLSNYPFDPQVPTRTVVLRGKMRRPKQKQQAFHSDVSGNPSQTQNQGFTANLRHVENILLSSEIPGIEETPVDEMREIERRVSASLYPKEQG